MTYYGKSIEEKSVASLVQILLESVILRVDERLDWRIACSVSPRADLTATVQSLHDTFNTEGRKPENPSSFEAKITHGFKVHGLYDFA